MHRLARALVGFCATRSRLILVAALVSLAISLAGIVQLRITADYRVFFSEDNPQLIDFSTQEALFHQTDTLIYALDGPVFAPETLEALRWLEARAAGLKHVSSTVAVTSYPHPRAIDDGFGIGAVAGDATGGAPASEQQMRDAARDAGITGLLIDAAERTALIIASVELPGADRTAEVPETVRPARDLAEDFRRRHPDIGLHLFGIVPFNQKLAEVTLRDLFLLFPVSLVIMAAVLVWLLGSVPAALGCGAVVLVSTAVAMGVAGFAGVVLSTATAVAPAIVLTLALAHSVHLLSVLQARLRAGERDARALEQSLALNLEAITLTSLSTIVGFLSLNFSDAPPFRELGNVVALGVLVSWLAALLVLPAWVLRFGCGASSRAGSDWWRRYGAWIVNRRRGLLPAMLLLLLPIAVLLPRNEINDVFREWFSLDDPDRVGIEFGIARLGGVEELHYTLDSGRADGVVDPQFMREVESFADWLREQPEVVHVRDHLHGLKRLNRVLRDDRPEQQVLPESAELGRQFLSILELAQPRGRTLNDRLDLDKRRVRMSLVLRPTSSTALRRFDRRARDWLADNAPAIATGQGSGALMMFAELGQRNARQLLAGAVLALVLISAMLVLSMRSLRLGLISLVPNLLPIAGGFALWALISAEINIAIAVVMGMTLGIVVDDTIHFLSKYRHHRRERSLGAADAVVETVATVAPALWSTTAVLVAGFGVLALSDFSPTADMGLLTAIVLALALALDLLLLPALLIRVDKQQDKLQEETSG